jgi:P27 family predicted phage terminase small subunit
MARPRKASNKRQNRETHDLVVVNEAPPGLDNKLTPPVELKPAAAQVWRNFWNSSVSSALDIDSDGFSVIRWITYVSEWFELTDAISGAELLVAGSNGQKVLNPLARRRQAVETALSAIEKQLGLTPTARAQLGLAVSSVKKAAAELLSDITSMPPAELDE